MSKKKSKRSSFLSGLNRAAVVWVILDNTNFGHDKLLLKAVPCSNSDGSPVEDPEPQFMLVCDTDDDIWFTLSESEIKGAKRDRKGFWNTTAGSMCGEQKLKIRFYDLVEIK